MVDITHLSDKINKYSPKLGQKFITFIILSINLLFLVYYPEDANGQVNHNQVVSLAENNSSQPVPWIGADVRNVSRGIATVLGVLETIGVNGVLVIEVSPGSPAEEAGLVGGNESVTKEVKLGGDIIIKADNKNVSSKNHFNQLLRQKNVGDNLTLSVLRADQIIDISVKVGSRPGYIYESGSSYADSRNVDFVSFESFDLEFEMSYPSRWEKVEEEGRNSVLFESNPENSTDNLREFIEVSFEPLRGNGALQEGISRNETIRLMENRLHERASGAFTNAISSLIVSNSSNIVFAGNPARMVEYDFLLPPVGQISAKDIIILDDDELYSIRYFVQGSKPDNYFSKTLETMIDSFKIYEVEKYENFEVGVRLEKLESWLTDETNEPYVDTVSFMPIIEDNSSAFQPRFRIIESFPIQDRSDQSEIFNDTIEFMKTPGEEEIQFRLINSSLGHLENMHQMHNVTYSYGDITSGRIITTDIIALENNRLYLITYRAAQADYSNYAPVLNKMIKSIEFFTTDLFSPSSHGDTNLGLLIEYPSDMSIKEIAEQGHNGNISFSFRSDIGSINQEMEPQFVINAYTKENSSQTKIGHDIAGQEANENKTFAINTTAKQPVDKPYFMYQRDDNQNTLQVNATYNNKEYNFRYSAEPSEYRQFIGTVEKIINSTKIIDSLPVRDDYLNESEKSELAAYDSIYGFGIKYPLDWIDDPIDLGNGAIELKPKKFGENTTLSLRIEAIPAEDRNIYDFVTDDIDSYTADHDDLKIFRSNSTNYGDYFAHELHYMAAGFFNMSKYIYTDKNNQIYIFSFSGAMDEFYTFLPITQQIIESLELKQIRKPTTYTGFKVGDGPVGIAINPRTHTIYVANAADNTLSAINSSDNELLSDVAVGNSPIAIAINDVKNTIYVAHEGFVNGSILVLDGENNTRIANIPLNMKLPISVAVNTNTDMIYVADGNSKNVSVIDGSTNKIIDSIATGRLINEVFSVDSDAIGIAVDPLRNRIYVANPSTNNVTVIDGSDNSILANISTSFEPTNTAAFITPFKNAVVSPLDIAVNQYTNVGYIIGDVEYFNDDGDDNADFYDRRLVAIDFANNRVTPYNVSGTGLNVVALNPIADTLYINDWGRDAVYAINATKMPNEPPTEINLDIDPFVLAVDPDANMIYVANIGSDTVSKINGNTNQVTYGVRFDINDHPINLPIFFGYNISVIPSKSINIRCNEVSISDNDYVHYNNGTQLKCSSSPKDFFSPLITSSWTGFDSSPSGTFTITRYTTITGTFIDLASLLQTIGPYISLTVLAGVVFVASIPSFWPKIRKLFSTREEQATSDTEKDERPIIEKPDIITADATVIIGVLIFISFSEGFEVAEQTQITIITVNIVFPFAISAVLAVRNHDKFAIRLMIAGFINLMISVILIAIMRL